MNEFMNEKITRRRFLMSAAALAAVPGLSILANGQQNNGQGAKGPVGKAPIALNSPLHFIAFGDWGTGTDHQKSVAEAMARYAEKHKATSPVQFAISLGDNFYEKGVASVDDPQWQIKFEQMYDKKRLPMPFISILGNHDWVVDPACQLAYAGAHPGTRWQMDGFWFKRSYSLGADTPLADFFYIDTDLWNYDVNRLQDQQMEWLTEGLKNSRAKWQIVVGHHPLYSNGEHAHDAEVLALRERLSPLLRQYGVDAYISGHDHDLQRNQVPGHSTLFLISGAAGKLRPKEYEDWKPFYASTPGFASLTITATEMSGQFLDADGKILDKWSQAPVSRQVAATSAVAAPVLAASPPITDTSKLPDLTIDLGEKNSGNGLSVPSESDGLNEAAVIGGSSARRTQGNYLYVAVDNAAYRGPLALWVTVESFGDATNRPTMQYDKTAATPDRASRYTRIEGTWTPLANGWQRGVFFLPDARLAHGQNQGGDFRLSGKSVAVRRLTVSPRHPA